MYNVHDRRQIEADTSPIKTGRLHSVSYMHFVDPFKRAWINGRKHSKFSAFTNHVRDNMMTLASSIMKAYSLLQHDNLDNIKN